MNKKMYFTTDNGNKNITVTERNQNHQIILKYLKSLGGTTMYWKYQNQGNGTNGNDNSGACGHYFIDEFNDIRVLKSSAVPNDYEFMDISLIPIDIPNIEPKEDIITPDNITIGSKFYFIDNIIDSNKPVSCGNVKEILSDTEYLVVNNNIPFYQNITSRKDDRVNHVNLYMIVKKYSDGEYKIKEYLGKQYSDRYYTGNQTIIDKVFLDHKKAENHLCTIKINKHKEEIKILTNAINNLKKQLHD